MFFLVLEKADYAKNYAGVIGQTRLKRPDPSVCENTTRLVSF